MATPAYQLAQFNIASGLGLPDDPVMAEFMANLDTINALAENSEGFIWRFQTDTGNATDVRPYDDERTLINLSVWESIETFRTFVYKSDHGGFVRRGKEWFSPKTQPQIVMWWIEAGALPAVEDGVARLQRLRTAGPGPEAFSFAKPYPPPGSAEDKR